VEPVIEITLEDVFMVTIRNSDAEDDWPTVKVNPMVGPFQHWLLENKIYSIRGTLSCGPHFITAAFPVEHKDAIYQWFMDNSWE
jgi:hypothetical protein